MNYEFQPSGKKKGRNRFVGSWRETGWRTIELPFSTTNLIKLLLEAQKLTSDFTHQDIIHWCDSYAMVSRMERLPKESKAVLEVVEDVTAQWDLFLVNTYALLELQNLNFSKVRLPIEWFVSWLKQAQALTLDMNH